MSNDTTETHAPQAVTTQSPIRKALTVFALILGLLFSSAAIAPDQVDAHTGAHTSCITTWNEGFWSTTTYARNDCGHTLSIKIERIALSDSACHRVSPGSSLRWAQGFWGSNRTTGVPC